MRKKGGGNQRDYGMRIYDSRLGKFLSEDPIFKEYPELTPYQFASNTPIQAIDLDGLEAGLALGGGSPYSSTTPKSVIVSISEYLNSPASDLEKRGLILQMNMTQNTPTDLKVSDFKGLTKWGYLWKTFAISRIGRNQGGRLNIPAQPRPQTPKVSVNPQIGKSKLTPLSSTTGTATVTRVQSPHRLSQRISVDESGNVAFSGTGKLYLTIDDYNHAKYFYNLRGGEQAKAQIISFQINKDFADKIRNNAIPQGQVKADPTLPEIADPIKSKSAYGLPSEYIKELEKNIIKGSGKIESP